MSTVYVDIPLDDSPFYDLSISLQGLSYILEFVYNERAQLYFMSVYDAEKNPIVLGVAVVPAYPILIDYAIPNLTGYFWLLKKATLESEPYKTYPDKLKQYYDFVYIYDTED